MLYYIIKVLVSAIIIVVVSEIAKRSSVFGALTASLPLTSLLAILWIKFEKVELEKITGLSKSIFWLVIPSLAFFLLFPVLINRGLQFWTGFGISVAITIVIYFILIWILRFYHISI